MRKLVRWVSMLLCVAVLSVSCVYAADNFGTIKSGRFDFREHKMDFIEGRAITNCAYDGEQPVKHWTITFDDKCQVKFITNLDDTMSRCWRWSHRIIHGKQA